MALRPLVLASMVGIAALGAVVSPAAQAGGYVSISVGTPAPHYGGRYGNHYGSPHHRPGYAWVPAHWVSTHRGRVWVPAQYVRVRGYGHGPGRDHRHGGYRGADTRVIHRPGSNHIVPRSYYPPGYLSPFDNRPRPRW